MESLGLLQVGGELSVLMQLPVKLDMVVEIREEKLKRKAFRVLPSKPPLPCVYSATGSRCLHHPGP